MFLLGERVRPLTSQLKAGGCPGESSILCDLLVTQLVKSSRNLVENA